MPSPDTTLPFEPTIFRQAVELVADADGWTTLKLASNAFKVLTPGQRVLVPRLVDLEASGLVECGLPGTTPGVRVRLRQPSAQPFCLDDAACLEAAFAYALGAKNSDPMAGVADLSAFINAVLFLRPHGLKGKHARALISADGRWDVFTPPPKQIGTRRVPPPSASRWYDEQDDDRDDEERDDRDNEPAPVPEDQWEEVPVFETLKLELIRRRPEHRWARTLTWFVPGDTEGRSIFGNGLAGAYERIQKTPNHTLANGTRVEIRRRPDGALDTVATYDRAADRWRLPGGAPLPDGYWDGNEFLLREELTAEQAARADAAAASGLDRRTPAFGNVDGPLA